MSLASFIQTAVFGPVSLSTEERSPCDGEAAWAAIQAHFRAEEEKARKAHGRVNAVREERRLWVHSALGAAKASVPTQPVSGAAANRGAV